jgi:hypothetical protein
MLSNMTGHGVRAVIGGHDGCVLTCTFIHVPHLVTNDPNNPTAYRRLEKHWTLHDQREHAHACAEQYSMFCQRVGQSLLLRFDKVSVRN